MDKTEFIEKNRSMMQVLANDGYPCFVSHAEDASWFKYEFQGQVKYIYNSEKVIICCNHLDLSVRLKSSNEYLEIVL